MTLKHTGMVQAMAYSSVAPPRDERPRDMSIYTSPHSIGERTLWQLRPMNAGTHVEEWDGLTDTLDEAPPGNPQYDWSQAKELVRADRTDVKLFPLMAVRNERDEIYAFGRITARVSYGGVQNCFRRRSRQGVG